jgi:hypothetical protein
MASLIDKVKVKAGAKEEKIFENSSKKFKIRCILQGFADRSVVAQEIGWFIKNIQPISVGV